MKMNTSIRKTPKGVTLIELSVVIAVILVLISVLFIGASYYRNSANNAACQVAQSSLQKAADSYMNVSNSSTVTIAGLTGAGLPFANANAVPSCPGDGTLAITTAGGTVTAVGCSGNTSGDHTDVL
jgi:prepilin-type N-terminal cleavage/methylation domain-containing protein